MSMRQLLRRWTLAGTANLPDSARRQLVHGLRRAIRIVSPPNNDITQQAVLDLCRQLSPSSAFGFKKIRIGNKHDGGYVFIDDFDEISEVISCGIQSDVSCDLAFAALGKIVLQFDHTVGGPPVQHPRFRFHKRAIDASGKIPGSVKLWDVM